MSLPDFERRLRWLPENWLWLPMWADDIWQRLLCLLWGHDPIPDQCGMPEHDYCAWCHRVMPGEGRP